jgi:hypothetical protein
VCAYNFGCWDWISILQFHYIFFLFSGCYLHILLHTLIVIGVNSCSTDPNNNKGNTKRGVSPRLKIRPCDLDHWPWKSIGFQILLRSKYVPSLVKIHWRMLILECSQGGYAVKIWPGDIDLWPWKPIRFQTLIRTKYVPSLVKIHWRMLILECAQGCYAVNIWPLDLWPWKSIGFQTLLRTMYVPSLVKIHSRILILECSQGSYAVKIDPVTLTFDLENQ